jgi:hypothetical protein
MDRDGAAVSSGAAWACGGSSGKPYARLRKWLLTPFPPFIFFLFFIPGSLGAKDGGNMLLLRIFGYSDVTGITFA